MKASVRAPSVEQNNTQGGSKYFTARLIQLLPCRKIIRNSYFIVAFFYIIADVWTYAMNAAVIYLTSRDWSRARQGNFAGQRPTFYC